VDLVGACAARPPPRCLVWNERDQQGEKRRHGGDDHHRGVTVKRGRGSRWKGGSPAGTLLATPPEQPESRRPLDRRCAVERRLLQQVECRERTRLRIRAASVAAVHTSLKASSGC